MKYHTPRRSVRLCLEELETRALPSATGIGALSAYPLTIVTPLGNITPSSSSSGPYTPAQIRQAYGFNQLPYNGAGQTIAIIDAYDDPTISSDLQTFDNAFGLPAPPSFVKAMPEGQPATNGSWAGEISLDVEWAHAIAPAANILLVEAASNSGSDLLNAISYAAQQPGVVAISMSWGSSEFSGEQTLDSYFTTPANHIGGSNLAGGITFVASSGDAGSSTGPNWPAVSPNVLAVGGTSLYLNSSGNYASETAWSDSGGGISVYEAPAYSQRSVQIGAGRDVPDVAYNADPNTGVYVYDSTPDANGDTGWFEYGGTSAGAPQWSALIALVDQGRAEAGKASLTNAQTLLYSLPSTDFHDVTSGSNGGYSAGPGYDLVTGLGTPQANLLIPNLIGANNGIVSGYSGVASSSSSSDGSTSSGGGPGGGSTGHGGTTTHTGSTGAGSDETMLYPSFVAFDNAPTTTNNTVNTNNNTSSQTYNADNVFHDTVALTYANRVSLELATHFHAVDSSSDQPDLSSDGDDSTSTDCTITDN